MPNSPTSPLAGTVLRLALLIGVVVVLYYAKGLLLPLALGGILAMLVNPIDERIRSWGWPAWAGITAAVFAVILFFAGLLFAIGQQAVNFVDTWPETQAKLEQSVNQLRQQTGLEGFIPELGSKAEGEESAGDSLMQRLPISSSSIIGFFTGTFGMFGNFLLMLVYIVMFLAQKERLRQFVLRRAPDSERGTTHQTLNESADIVQKYLRGRLILILILSVLYSVGFLIVGLNYAVLIAVLVAVMSIIPYIGNLIGGLFAVALAFASGGDGNTAVIGVLITMSLAQTLESYVLTPLIVGDEVDINPLTTIVCVIGMNMVWGPVGAIIAIPIFAILRIVFSHIDGLRDYAYLMGQEE